MASIETKEYRCPACGAELTAELRHSVSTKAEPELREKVLDGSLFRHVCPQCGDTRSMLYACLYHDEKRRALIYLIPGYDRSDPRQAEVLAGLSQLDCAMSGYAMRIVTTPAQLSEKARILEAGLDDRVIELCKCAAYMQLTDEQPDFELAASWFEHTEDGDTVTLADAKGCGSVVLTSGEDGLYDAVKAEYADTLAAMPSGFEVVDILWASSMM